MCPDGLRASRHGNLSRRLDLRPHLEGRWVSRIAGPVDAAFPLDSVSAVLGAGAFSSRHGQTAVRTGQRPRRPAQGSPVGTASCGKSIAPNGSVVCTRPLGVVKTIVPSGSCVTCHPLGPQ